MLTTVMAMILAGGAQAEQAAPGQSDAVEQQMSQAIAAIRAGQNAQALTLLDPLAADVNVKIVEAKGQVYCAQSNTEALLYMARARPDAPTVRVLSGRNCGILFLRGYVLENLQRLPEAIAQLRKLVDLEPGFPHFQVEYASALRQSGDMSAALAAYRHAVEIAAPNQTFAPDHAAALRGIGFVLTERGDLDGAEQAYRESLTLAPGNALAMKELAYIYHLRKTGTKTSAQTVETNITPPKAPDQDHKQAQ